MNSIQIPGRETKVFNVHKGVVLFGRSEERIGSDDSDLSLLPWVVDKFVSDADRAKLLAVYKDRDSFGLIWRESPSKDYAVGVQADIASADAWTLKESIVAK